MSRLSKFTNHELYVIRRKKYNAISRRYKSSSETLPYVMLTDRSDKRIKILTQVSTARFTVAIYDANGETVRSHNTYHKALGHYRVS